MIVNGHYGQRIAAILQAHGTALAADTNWLAPIELELVDVPLVADRDIRHVVAVHNETTSGRLNDLEGVGRRRWVSIVRCWSMRSAIARNESTSTLGIWRQSP